MLRETAEKLILNVGRRVAELRRATGQTQEQLAERLGVSVQYVSRIEAGTNLTLATMVSLARALKVPTIELLHPPGPEARSRRGRPRKTV